MSANKEPECIILPLHCWFKNYSAFYCNFSVIIPPSWATIKLSTYDGNSSCQFYKTKFLIALKANGSDLFTKAFHFATSLKSDTDETLETFSENQWYNFGHLFSALELCFGEMCIKEYSSIQLKSRFQRPVKNFQQLAEDIQRLSCLAFSNYPFEARHHLASNILLITCEILKHKRP